MNWIIVFVWLFSRLTTHTNRIFNWTSAACTGAPAMNRFLTTNNYLIFFCQFWPLFLQNAGTPVHGGVHRFMPPKSVKIISVLKKSSSLFPFLGGLFIILYLWFTIECGLVFLRNIYDVCNFQWALINHDYSNISSTILGNLVLTWRDAPVHVATFY